MFNPTPQTIAQADLDTLNLKINDVVAQLILMNNTNVALTKEERIKGATVGIKRKPFNDFVYGNKAANVQFAPAASATDIGTPDADKHFFIQNGMAAPMIAVKGIMEIMEDMQMNAEHNAHRHASQWRDAGKAAKDAGKPGADTWFDGMDELFPQRGPETPNP